MNNEFYNQQNYIPQQPNSLPRLNSFYKNDYAEEILKTNIGAEVTAHVSFTDSVEWRDSIFQGTLIKSGKDYIVIKDSSTEKKYLIWSVYIDYIIFNNSFK